jgi:hypothetical protein
MYLGVLLAIIPVSVGWYLTYQHIFDIFKREYPIVLLTWYYIAGPFFVCISYYMPIYALSDLFTSLLIGSLTGHFKTWSEKLNEANEIKDETNLENK